MHNRQTTRRLSVLCDHLRCSVDDLLPSIPIASPNPCSSSSSSSHHPNNDKFIPLQEISLQSFTTRIQRLIHSYQYQYQSPSPPLIENYSNHQFSCQHVIVELLGNGCLSIVLNRAQHLNSLTVDMYLSLTYTMVHAAFDEKVRYVVLSAGDKDSINNNENGKAKSSSSSSSSKKPVVFCAGGDIKNLSPWNEQSKVYAPFFTVLELNFPFLVHCLFTQRQKPFVCMMQGAVIGGAQSLYSGATFRVANRDHFSVSLPETRNGLLGPVFFARQRTVSFPLLLYYVLTGSTIGALDAMINGHINQVAVDNKAFHLLMHELRTMDNSIDNSDDGDVQSKVVVLDRVTRLMNKYCMSGDELERAISQCHFSMIRSIVEETFNERSLFQIIDNLKARIQSAHSSVEVRAFCEKTLSTLGRMSPMSLLLTHKLLTEYVMNGEVHCIRHSSHCIPYLVAIARMGSTLFQGHDFKEAVKNILIVKSRSEKPVWHPWSSIFDIDDTIAAQEMVEDILTSTSEGFLPTFLPYETSL